MQPPWQILQALAFAVGLFVLIQIPFMLLTFVAALRETRRKTVYVPVDESEALPANGYMDAMNAACAEAGFEYLAVCRAGNPRLYKTRYDVWASPDGDTFAAVGAGRVIGIPQQATWLTTKFVDGRVFITLDNPSGMSTDMSGMTEWVVVANADFRELLARHRARVEAEVTPVEPYSHDDPIGDQIEMIGKRAERMDHMGYVVYLDDERDTWRFNTRGAFAAVLYQYRKIFFQIFKNYHRRSMPRPGDHGYVPSGRGRLRSFLKAAEIGCLVTLFLAGRLATERAANPRQALFRVAVLLAAFLGLVTVWVVRWRIGSRTVDPAARRRRRLGLVLVGATVVVVGYFATRVDRKDWDGVTRCELLSGGGKVYVVVDTLHYQTLTPRILTWLKRPVRPGFRNVEGVKQRRHVLESDGKSTRRSEVPAPSSFDEFMPRGPDLYLVDFDGERVSRWEDGKPVPLPDDEAKAFRQGLADEPAAQCKAEGWEYAELDGTRNRTLARTFKLGDREVGVDLAMERLKVGTKLQPAFLLRARLSAPGGAPLAQTFPPGVGR